jgi:colanic acid biosynthesis glycosyl transferase WcaI
MRVLFINQVFYPDVAATAQHGHDLGKYLVAHGHEVTAIASRSIYGETGVALPKNETADGIKIYRVARSLFGKSTIVGRLFDFLFFYIAATWRALTLPRHDVVICFTTPPFIAYSGIILRLFKKTRVVHWVMDLYPDVPVACGLMRKDSLLTHSVACVSRQLLHSVDMNVVLGRCMEDLVRSKGVDDSKITLIGVWSDHEEVSPIDRGKNTFRQLWNVGDRTLIMYSGNFGLGHDLETFLSAALQLRDDDRVMFAFVGGGRKKPEVEAFVSKHGLESSCVLAEYQPREQLKELLSAGDVHLVSLLDGAEGCIVPCKLFGIMAAARPALFIGNPASEISRVIVEDDCGASVAEGDVDALLKAISRYVESPEEGVAAGDRARQSLIDHHTREHRCKAWLDLLESLAKK